MGRGEPRGPSGPADVKESLMDAARRFATRLHAVKQLHGRPGYRDAEGFERCGECGHKWPCRTWEACWE